ncbi:MAG: KGG domain-containing protein [Clostridia bacterium]|nr:KGG domain-containing protein [Clostridia bacterium]
MANHYPNLDNLIPFSERSLEERRELGSKGGKNSGEVRRRKRSMRETCDIVLAMPIKSLEEAELIDIADMKSFVEAKGKNVTVQDVMILRQVQLALAGSHRSFEFIRDTVGEKPKERIETSTETLDRLDEVLANIGGVV